MVALNKPSLHIEEKVKSAYKIAKELHHRINTILNEIRRGTVPQIKNKRKIDIYLAIAWLS